MSVNSLMEIVLIIDYAMNNITYPKLVSMRQCKKDVTPLLTYLGYVFLAPTLQYIPSIYPSIIRESGEIASGAYRPPNRPYENRSQYDIEQRTCHHRDEFIWCYVSSFHAIRYSENFHLLGWLLCHRYSSNAFRKTDKHTSCGLFTQKLSKMYNLILIFWYTRRVILCTATAKSQFFFTLYLSCQYISGPFHAI